MIQMNLTFRTPERRMIDSKTIQMSSQSPDCDAKCSDLIVMGTHSSVFLKDDASLNSSTGDSKRSIYKWLIC